MGLTRQEAFSILDVPKGSSEDQVRSAYKKLALKWHPDKHGNSEEATKKFQDISAAYKRLTSTEDDFSEIIITPEDMFDLFAQMFFGQRTFRSNGFFYAGDSSDDDVDDESDDDSNDCDGHGGKYRFSYPFPPSSSSSKKSKPTVFSYTARRPTASEASKNAEELMKEEERQQKQREKKKNKKKRQKEKRRLEKEKKEQEDEEKKKLVDKKREEAERARKLAEEEESSSESDSEEEENIAHAIKIETSKTSNNNKNINGKKAKSSSSSNNNLTNGQIPGSGKGDATINKKPNPTANDKKTNPSTSDKKSSSSANNDKKSTPTRKSKKEPAHNHITTSSDGETDPEETLGLDPTSAFFVNAAATASKKINSQPQPKPKKEKDDKNKINGKKKTEDAESIEDMDPVILRSRQIAVKGNEMANLGHFPAAVELFTQAIQLNPRDFRFFGNRSFCFDRLDMYDKALKDAERAITLAKDWPKGYFRKGRALSGLRLYAEAENAFEQVLKLDKNCDEAVEELRRVRGYRLMEMGFTRPQSEAAIRQYGTVQAALEVLLVQGAPSERSSQAFGEDVYLSDEEDYITETIEQSKTDSGNPEGLRSIWVGNVQATVSEKELRDLFGQYGEIHSVRRLQEKFCCFINFKRPTQAATAMSQLQNQDLHGRNLLIKFPDNPIIEGQPRTTILKKTVEQKKPQQPKLTKQQKQQQQQQQQQLAAQASKQSAQQTNGAQDKLTGPVNGDECYFWRTTGCAFGDRCKYKHIAACKGVDRQVWQKTLYKN